MAAPPKCRVTVWSLVWCDGGKWCTIGVPTLPRWSATWIMAQRALIMASATPSASGQGQAPQHWRTGALEDTAVIAVAMFSSLPLSAPDDHTCTRTNSTSCIPSSSVTNVRNMLKSCDNHAGREKRNGNMFRRHAECVAGHCHCAAAMRGQFLHCAAHQSR